MKPMDIEFEAHMKFTRDAMHKKLSDSEKKHLLKEIKRLHGISKRKTTDEQIHEASEKVFAMLE